MLKLSVVLVNVLNKAINCGWFVTEFSQYLKCNQLGVRVTITSNNSSGVGGMIGGGEAKAFFCTIKDMLKECNP